MNHSLSAMAFAPPKALKNRHIQTIFSSVGPRRFKVRKAFKPFKQQQQEFLLDGNNGVRLQGFLNTAVSNSQPNKKLVILIHGWEGSADSSYMLSMATALLQQGVDVFRLNLRDHGETHHLNEQIFNSTMDDEVIGAIEDVQQRLNYDNYYLGGFSLGGNFCLRVAAKSHNRKVSLSKVFAFCPAIHAAESNAVLNDPKNWLYGNYFVRKWKKSLRKKLAHFPEYQYGEQLDSMKTLDQMNQELVPVYTPYDDVDEYFEAYAVTGDRLADTICPCYCHFAADDMIIPSEHIGLLNKDNTDLHITVSEHGGHCGFLMNWRLDSWQDARAVELVTAP